MITGVARRPPLRVPAEVSDFNDVIKALLDQTARPIYVRVLRATPEGGDEQTTHVLVLGPGKGGFTIELQHGRVRITAVNREGQDNLASIRQECKPAQMERKRAAGNRRRGSHHDDDDGFATAPDDDTAGDVGRAAQDVDDIDEEMGVGTVAGEPDGTAPGRHPSLFAGLTDAVDDDDDGESGEAIPRRPAGLLEGVFDTKDDDEVDEEGSDGEAEVAERGEKRRVVESARGAGERAGKKKRNRTQGFGVREGGRKGTLEPP